MLRRRARRPLTSRSGPAISVDSAIEPRPASNPSAPFERPRERSTQLTRGIIVAMAALALALGLYQLSRPNMLFGVSEYDDGAYFGSAIRLVNGALPYRDFVLVQPPGFTLLASPVALLSHLMGTDASLAVARILMPMVAALNVVLVGVLVRHRGPVATLVTTGVMTVFPAEIHATHTLLLEPFLDLFCLVGAVRIFDGDRFTSRTRSLVMGGLAFGFAGSIKGWALIPVLAIIVLCLPQVRRRLMPFASGVALGFALPTLPFALLAPASFYREVVSTQLGRIAGSGRVGVGTRLGDLTGSSSLTPNAGSSLGVAIVLLAALIALTIATVVWRGGHPTTFESFVFGSMLGIGVLLMAPAEFYDHYSAFFAPFAAMAVGCGVGLVAARATRRVAMAVAAVGVLALAANQVRVVSGLHGTDLTSTVGAVIPAHSCALSDSAAYLITINRFVSDRPGCADNITDPYGTTISNGGRTAAAVAVWQHAIENADYLVLYSIRNGRIPLVPALRAEIADDFSSVKTGSLMVFVRNGFPIG